MWAGTLGSRVGMWPQQKGRPGKSPIPLCRKVIGLAHDKIGFQTAGRLVFLAARDGAQGWGQAQAQA